MYKRQHIHFIGVGGIGMSGIATLLLKLGYHVSGSDLKETETTRRLTDLGGVIYYGHRAENIRGAGVVVVSSAIPPDNPELLAAKAAKIPVIPRAEMLAELMRLHRYGVAVAGAHGKTTTSSMVAAVLSAGGLDPTSVIGGKVNGLGTNARLGQRDFIVAEADESDGSFLLLTPSIVVVTNIDAEHLDHYRDLGEIQEAFVSFINKVPFYGVAIVCLDDPHLSTLLPRLKKRLLTYGLSAQADIRATDIVPSGHQTSFVARYQNRILGRIVLPLAGIHNVVNALAALAVGLELEIPFRHIREGLEGFAGVARRLEILGEAAGAVFIDDYAHHPTEIRASLAAVRDMFPKRPLLVVFQPHRYTRTKALWEQFATCFFESDRLVVTDIYPASEPEIPGVEASALAKAIADHGHGAVTYVPKGGLIEAVASMVRPGEVVVTLGAGDIGRLARAIFEYFQKERAQCA
ncbi:UDP-N-acetylmuramate--L-alanine ligase [Thermosulfuriphilus ammonigenes]|uniref:UDP-N-acetylmuramate--L-alanine ligase n=2 Tax=Thermosulfuriphilus ammonigenes TaxID=1936021 RepID=A0A6G7PY80_9BACT|nr:UDP-N-acetylmuramate--L-alanine ligase [Thermosulfuriphilus ammonigenes]MBA2849436.1 UDP-N-acetylmuramate--alanine ligase [Thermosulfuriphilus ammonigenes]QIJ72506.1 UDP-N-acetylmuramate--L-alanine ligase [Thermosulfuriphilus ammonigenes]